MAGNFGVKTTKCLAQIETVERYKPPAPIEIVLTFMGNSDHGLLGLQALGRWFSTFDGPKCLLSIFEEYRPPPVSLANLFD